MGGFTHRRTVLVLQALATCMMVAVTLLSTSLAGSSQDGYGRFRIKGKLPDRLPGDDGGRRHANSRTTFI